MSGASSWQARGMSIAITEDHQSLAKTADDFLHRRDARGSARALLEAPDEALPSWWGELVELGWLGLHVPEAQGGSGYGLEELVVVIEQLGSAVAPGPFVPTVIVERGAHRSRRCDRRRAVARPR